MKPEDQIIQKGGIMSRMYKYRFEVCLFVFMAAILLATVIAALIPDGEHYSMPCIIYGVVWGFGALGLMILAYLGWWLYVALFKMED